MDETAHARAAFREGIGDITPEALRARLEAVLETASMTPGALTVLTATVLGGSTEDKAAARRGAGIQMSYEGLKLSRKLIRTDPWTTGDRADGDMDAVAAEVLVARGFEYLAHTVVAEDIVEAVQCFGRNQTRREEPELSVDRTALDSGLETDFIRIAVIAGADIGLETVPEAIESLADELAAEIGNEPLPETDIALAGLKERFSSVNNRSRETSPRKDYSRSPGT